MLTLLEPLFSGLDSQLLQNNAALLTFHFFLDHLCFHKSCKVVDDGAQQSVTVGQNVQCLITIVPPSTVHQMSQRCSISPIPLAALNSIHYKTKHITPLFVIRYSLFVCTCSTTQTPYEFTDKVNWSSNKAMRPAYVNPT